MAKAVFQRNQKVWVESVGAWAIVERIDAVWAKGFDEPVRVTYDVGLGRPFHAHELRPEDPMGAESEDQTAASASWRLMRARNKWQTPEECATHPFPGTYPVVVTDTSDWGGWRVPGAEYDRDPHRIEWQARLIASTPALRQIARELLSLMAEATDAPPALEALARKAKAIERFLAEVPEPQELSDAANVA
ncbi:MAG TPA: hypothetical protein VFE13_02950 [Caulobacteraceae bacterium]|nr:hypothetical protein [Caulobacteraceae bacterium]